MPPTVSPGDTVNFVNAGAVVPAVVQRVNDDGSVTLLYQPLDYPAPVRTHGIPWCPPGGSYGWQSQAAEPPAAA